MNTLGLSGKFPFLPSLLLIPELHLPQPHPPPLLCQTWPSFLPLHALQPPKSVWHSGPASTTFKFAIPCLVLPPSLPCRRGAHGGASHTEVSPGQGMRTLDLYPGLRSGFPPRGYSCVPHQSSSSLLPCIYRAANPPPVLLTLPTASHRSLTSEQEQFVKGSNTDASHNKHPARYHRRFFWPISILGCSCTYIHAPKGIRGSVKSEHPS